MARQLQCKDFSELPLTLTVSQVAAIMGINKNAAYQLCRQTTFPSVRVGRRIVVPKAAFERWLCNQAG